MTKMTETDQCDSHCPLQKALSLLQGKYSTHIIRQLIRGPLRFNEFLKCIPGISKKTLSDKLKYYTDVGLVERVSYSENPPRMEYRLTEQKAALGGIISNLEYLGKELDEDTEVKNLKEMRPPKAKIYRSGILQ